jgi:hypothetical protein
VQLTRTALRPGVALLAIVMLVASSSAALASHKTAVRRAPTAQGSLIFTKSSIPAGNPQTPPCTPAAACASDLHFTWKSNCTATNPTKVVLDWTVNGYVVGNPFVAPCRANDLEFTWNPNFCVTSAFWTLNGVKIARLGLMSRTGLLKAATAGVAAVAGVGLLKPQRAFACADQTVGSRTFLSRTYARFGGQAVPLGWISTMR